ncbi:hypothetical protein C0991_006182 [Blastosporella zonata]|nr:hypothetical protein C0991_006182 [Blastosporella zonata]
MADDVGLSAVNNDWWNDVHALNGQFDFGLGYGNAPRPYMTDAQGNPQWLLTTPSGETSMDVSDVAMLWLQAPQMSDWMDIGGF